MVNWILNFSKPGKAQQQHSQGYLEGVSRPRMTVQRSWSAACQIAITQQQTRPDWPENDLADFANYVAYLLAIDFWKMGQSASHPAS